MGWWERPDEVGDEQRGRVDPLWWGIALALGGVFVGLILMLAG